ncbi:MAG TPA: DUF1848 domain-containing protein [Spirochaetota bacterium]|nr:DUF1848 domain-containing protein [Spirochaetota bacterium]
MKKWPLGFIGDDPQKKPARSPLIISASRATDIPAFYGDWLVNQFDQGFVNWINPYNRKQNPIDLRNCRLIIFWTKNAAPFLKYLSYFDSKGINYYFLHTLNNYETEGYEPGVPPLKKRIRTFKMLSDLIGPEKIIWRFDPILLSDKLTLKELLLRIRQLSKELSPYTRRLIISFIKIERYKSVKRNIIKTSFPVRELNHNEKIFTAESIQHIFSNSSEKPVTVQTCGTAEDFSSFGINHGSCIDYNLITDLFHNDTRLMDFLEYTPSLFDNDNTMPSALKASGQQPFCNCLQSADIGAYNSCPHHCVYCYANHTPDIIKKSLD